MSKKTLLNEATIRRFMKLAEMEPLAGDFVNEMFTEEAPVYQDDEEPTPEEAEFDAAYEEEGEEEGFEAGEEAAEEDLGLDLEDEESDAELEAEEAGELTLTDEEADAFLKVADKVRAAVEAAPAGEELEAPDMGGEELEIDAEEIETEPELDTEPPAEEESEEIEVDEEELVQEIARRVAKRLLTQQNK